MCVCSLQAVFRVVGADLSPGSLVDAFGGSQRSRSRGGLTAEEAVQATARRQAEQLAASQRASLTATQRAVLLRNREAALARRAQLRSGGLLRPARPTNGFMPSPPPPTPTDFVQYGVGAPEVIVGYRTHTHPHPWYSIDHWWMLEFPDCFIHTSIAGRSPC